MTHSVSFELNGQSVTHDTSHTTRLSSLLRESCDCLDVKIGCNAGDCGACTVLVDGKAVCACLTAVGQVSDKSVETLVGLDSSCEITQSLQSSFLRHGAAQCGICTPGMLVSAVALLRERQHPTLDEVQDALGGVLCRCTGYRKIIDAVLDAGSGAGTSAVSGDAIKAGDVLSACSKDLQHGLVGQPMIRIDGLPKVSGTDKFGDDVAPAGALALRLVRSPYHRASFAFGDVDAYVKSKAGLVRVFTAEDIPGRNLFGIIPNFIDQPVFAETATRFKGEAVAAVVGDATAIAGLDLDDFPVSFSELDASLTPMEALEDSASLVHTDHGSNVLCGGKVICGDARKAIDDSFLSVRGRFSTGFVEHAYIEPEAGYAVRVGDTLEIYGCTQAAYLDRESVAAIMALPEESIRVVPSACGGGFGSKLDISFQPFVALAAWVLNKPVKIAYTRTESMQSTTKRHASDMRLEISVDETGKLKGFLFDGTFNTGAYASWGPTVANRVPVHASGPYHVRDYHAQAHGIYTHTSPAGAFRGFGVPQVAIAQESLFDDLANALDMDRLAFRQLNALDGDMPTVTGQQIDSYGIKACLDALENHWQNASADAVAFNRKAVQDHSPWRRGIGIASGWYGCGNTSLPNPSTIKSGITSAGKVCLHQGAIDIGQGANTVILQIFADTLGVAAGDIEIIGPDTAVTPDAGKTSASRQTFVSGAAARLSALSLREQIVRLTNCTEIQTLQCGDGLLQVNAGADTLETATIKLDELLVNDDGYVLMAIESYDPPTEPLDENGQGVPYAMYGYAAQLAIVDVDTRLGVVRLEKFIAAHDVGKAINPVLAEGQIQGGIAQGVGLALMEEFIPGRTENLHDYLIPTIGDIPPIESILVEVPDAHGPFGAKGLGEHVLIPTAPAVLNAIADASGARVTELPATPDKILAAIHSKEQTINVDKQVDA